MRKLFPSNLNTLHFYPTDIEAFTFQDVNFMEKDDLYWQPIPAIQFMPISFATKYFFGPNLGVETRDEKGRVLCTMPLLHTALDSANDLYAYFTLHPVTQEVLKNNIGKRLVISVATRDSSNNALLPLYSAYVEVKTLDWMQANCIVLSTQLKKYTNGAPATTGYLIEGSIPQDITWYSWFPGANKLSENQVEDSSNFFRDQGWGDNLVSRRVNTVHAIRIGDSKGVPFWMYEKVQTFVSCKLLYFNDSIKVCLSSSDAPKFTALPDMNRGTISFGLTEVGDNLTYGDDVPQTFGDDASRQSYSLTFRTDSSYFLAQDNIGKSVLYVPDKALIYENETRGAILEYTRTTPAIAIQSNLPNVTVDFTTASLYSVNLETSRRVSAAFIRLNDTDYTEQAVAGSSYKVRNYKPFATRYINFIALEEYTNFAAPPPTVPIGLGLLYNPIIHRMEIKTIKTPVYALYRYAQLTTLRNINYPVDEVTSVAFVDKPVPSLGNSYNLILHVLSNNTTLVLPFTASNIFKTSRITGLNISSALLSQAGGQPTVSPRGYGIQVKAYIVPVATFTYVIDIIGSNVISETAEYIVAEETQAPGVMFLGEYVMSSTI